jgi:RimJ/RimL family protein N-acetyltransferase
VRIGAGVTPIATKRLRLRPFTLDDAPFVLGLLNEPSFLEHIGDKGARDLDGARKYLTEGPLAMYAEHGFGLLMVEARASGAPIGMCGLLRRPTLDAPDLGYALMPAFRGQGYAFEACRAVLAWGSAARGFDRILAIVTPGNAASIALLHKLRFRDAGRREMSPGEEVLVFDWRAA